MNLYKYTSIDENAKSNLENNRLYLQSPVKFNDPYEFVLKFSVKDEIFIDFLKLFYGDQYTKYLRGNMSKAKVLEYIRDCFFSELTASLGVSCLTENKNDDIMWAHYGGNHKGICIEFDKNKLPFNLCEQVEYVNEVVNIEIDNLSNLETQDSSIFNNVFLRKNTIWEYEKEWRLVSKANSFVKYLPDAIKSITFGFFCDEKSKTEIYKSTDHLGIKYFEVLRSKVSYKIEKKLLER
jgi:hypothetical protein